MKDNKKLSFIAFKDNKKLIDLLKVKTLALYQIIKE